MAGGHTFQAVAHSAVSGHEIASYSYSLHCRLWGEDYGNNSVTNDSPTLPSPHCRETPKVSFASSPAAALSALSAIRHFNFIQHSSVTCPFLVARVGMEGAAGKKDQPFGSKFGESAIFRRVLAIF